MKTGGVCFWIGTSKGLVILDPESEQFLHHSESPDSCINLLGSHYKFGIEDHRGIHWIGSDSGLIRYDPKIGAIRTYRPVPGDANSLNGSYVRSIFEDNEGVLWIGTDSALNRFDRQQEQFESFTLSSALQSNFAPFQIIREDKWGNLWIAGGQVLRNFDRKTKQFQTYRHDPKDPHSLSENWLRSLYVDRRGELWIGGGSVGGLDRFDQEKKQFVHYRQHGNDLNSLSSNVVYSIYEDRQGGFWIGTETGLNYFNRFSMQFQYYRRDPANPNSLNSFRLSSIHEDRAGMLWIGTLGSGLNRFDRTSGRVTHFRNNPGDAFSLANNHLNSNTTLEDQKGRLWFGTRGGLNRFDPEQEHFLHYVYKPQNPKDLFLKNLIQAICEGPKGTIWMGTRRGLNRFDPATKDFEHFPHLPADTNSMRSHWVSALLMDSRGHLWIGTHRGLDRFDPVTKQFLRPKPEMQNRDSINNTSINALFEDSQGNIWVGTGNQGLHRVVDLERGIFKQYTEKDGLASNFITSQIQEDERGSLWFGTNRGLTKFNPGEERFYNYNSQDGLVSNTIYTVSKSPLTGALFLNGEALTVFHPDSIQENRFKPRIVITSLERYRAGDIEGTPIEVNGIATKRAINLSYTDHMLSFEFAVLDYHNPGKNQYAYMLEGLGDKWIELGTERRVNFGNLNPGAYTLRIRGANSAGTFTEEKALHISIRPPWWKTNLAYLFYGLLFSAALYGLYRFQLRRKLEKAQATRLKELDAIKTRLYTNITHEFRTPLAVIRGMTDEILDEPRKKQEQSIELIKRNTDNVLQLVNQMLDLRKPLESGKMPINWTQGDVIHYLRYIQEPFHSFASSKNIRLHFLPDVDHFTMDQDSKKLRNIVSNLLSNAIQFTPEGGDVYFLVQTNQDLVLTVRDNGIGIPAEKLSHIFDRFYQGDDSSTRRGEGTGIGLALTKELVKLMDGKISVKSTPGKGSEFTVVLPVHRRAAHQALPTPPLPAASEAVSSGKIVNAAPLKEGEQPLVLIIEDNSDVRQYITNCFIKSVSPCQCG